VCVALSPYRIAEKTTESFNSVVSFESEERSFFCRSSEENRSHLLGREREKKKIFDSVNMSSYRRPDNPERTLWTEFDEKEDCGVTFSKFGIETCEEMITREEDCDRSAAEKSRGCRTERRVGAKKSSSKEEEKGKDTLPPFETTPKTINTNNISPERIAEKEEEEGKEVQEKATRRASVLCKHERGKKSPSSVFISTSSSLSSSFEDGKEEGEEEEEKNNQQQEVKVADSTNIFSKEAEKKISAAPSSSSSPFSATGGQKINRNKNRTFREEEEEKENEEDKQSGFDVEKEKERELRRQNVLERVQRVAEILALTPTTTPKKEGSTEREGREEANEDTFAVNKKQERVALTLIDEEDGETELYSKVAALRLQLRRYKELASTAQKRNEGWETERFELTKETNELKIERFKLKSCLDVLSAQQQVQEYVESSSSNRDEEEEEEQAEENSRASEKKRRAKVVSEVLEKATLEMENAAKANVAADNRSVQAMREAQQLEDELVAYKEASREENEALMIEASRSRIRAREFQRELEESKENFTLVEKELRAALAKTIEEHEKVMDEKDKRTHTLRLRLEEIEKRNTFLESKNEELETALESDAGAYYGAQLRKVREAHEEILSREQVKLERVQEELRIEKEKVAKNKSEFENVKRALKSRTSENEKDNIAAWSNALGLNDMDDNNNMISSLSSPSSPSSPVSSATSSDSAAAASATKRLQMKQQRMEMQDSLLRMAKDEIEELRDINRRLLERQTSRCNSSASLYRSDSAQGIPTVPSSRASSRPLSRTSSRNNNNFNAFDDHQIPEDDELSLEAREFLNSPYYCGVSPHRKNRASGEKLRKTDSSVSLSLRETANDDVNLAPLGSWASFEAAAASPKSDDYTDDGDILSLTNTTNATSEEEEEEEREERDAELLHNSRKLQAFFEKRAAALSRSSSASSRLTEHRGYSASKALEMSIKEGEAVMRSVNVRASKHFSRPTGSKGASDRYYDENGE
jgi:hypothetical protein